MVQESITNRLNSGTYTFKIKINFLNNEGIFSISQTTMSPNEILNIRKEYTIDKSFDDSFNQIHEIVLSPFNSSRFSTFGMYDNDIGAFILMAKWYSVGRPLLAGIASTKVFVWLSKNNTQTKIILKTKTNPLVFLVLFICVLELIVSIATYENAEDIKRVVICLFLAIATLGFDRFIKNILVGSFEEDVKTALGSERRKQIYHS